MRTVEFAFLDNVTTDEIDAWLDEIKEMKFYEKAWGVHKKEG